VKLAAAKNAAVKNSC